MKHHCIVPNCQRDGLHAITLRLRRPDTSAVWAPNTDAYLCDEHAVGGAEIELTFRVKRTRRLDISTRGENRGKVGIPVSKAVPITQGARRSD